MASRIGDQIAAATCADANSDIYAAGAAVAATLATMLALWCINN